MLVPVTALLTYTSSWHDTYLKEPSNQDVVRRVEEVAKRHGAKMAQVALAWCMAKDGVAAPIVGTTSLDKLKELICKIPCYLMTSLLNDPQPPSMSN